MQRRTAIVLGIGLLGAGAVPLASHTTSAQAAPEQGWYVALGDSLAAGYQPGSGDDRAGGYVGPVLDAARKGAPGLDLKNLSCSGEDTTTMTSGTRCSYPEGSQLAAAESFLRDKGDAVRLVTVQVGANDVQRCAEGTDIDMACLQAGMQAVQRILPTILGKLRAAAPNARIVVANYYNPFLATWLLGADGQSVARLSATLQGGLNGIIAAAAKGINALVADVASAYDSTDWTPTTTDLGELPTNVATICSLTWMCAKNDIHANDAGYRRIAQAVIDVMGRITGPGVPSPTGSPTTRPTGKPTSPPTGRPTSRPTPPTPAPTPQPSGPLVQTG